LKKWKYPENYRSFSFDLHKEIEKIQNGNQVSESNYKEKSIEEIKVEPEKEKISPEILIQISQSEIQENIKFVEENFDCLTQSSEEAYAISLKISAILNFLYENHLNL